VLFQEPETVALAGTALLAGIRTASVNETHANRALTEIVFTIKRTRGLETAFPGLPRLSASQKREADSSAKKNFGFASLWT